MEKKFFDLIFPIDDFSGIRSTNVKNVRDYDKKLLLTICGSPFEAGVIRHLYLHALSTSVRSVKAKSSSRFCRPPSNKRRMKISGFASVLIPNAQSKPLFMRLMIIIRLTDGIKNANDVRLETDSVIAPDSRKGFPTLFI